jgi:hypothetical protein
MRLTAFLIFGAFAIAVMTSSVFAHEGEDHSGTIEVEIADDFVNKKSEFIYYLNDPVYKERLKLEFKDRQPNFVHGQKVRIKGKKKVGDSKTVILAEGDATVMGEAVVMAAVANSRSVLSLRVNFTNASVSCTESSISTLLFDDANAKSVDNFYATASQGRVGVNGVVKSVNVNMSVGSSCDYYSWQSAADSAARAQGIDPAAYDHVNYVLPSSVSCSWSGLGQVYNRLTWVKACSTTMTFAHELGHNFGMGHATTATSSYGDYSDAMGGSYREMNAPHRDQMQWLPAANIVTVSSSGTYRIAPLEDDGSTVANPQVLKVYMASAGDYVYLGYRKPEGSFDYGMSTTYANRVSVHRYKGSGSSTTLFSKAMTTGESYSDTADNLTVTVTAITTDYAEVNIQKASLLKAPSALTATQSATNANGSIVLKWTDNSADESGFEVMRSTDGTNYSLATTLASNTTTFTQSGLTDATTYYFKVRAINATMASTFTAAASVATAAETSVPASPSSLTVSNSSVYPQSRLILKWTDNSTREDGYEVWRATSSGGTYTRIATLGVNAKEYYNDGLPRRYKYYYKVRAYNSRGYSSYSSIANGTTK